MSSSVDALNVAEDTFKQVVGDIVFPLFPGSDFASNSSVQLPSKNRHKLVTQVASGTDLKLMPHEDSKFCHQVHRSQVFSADEKEVVRAVLKSAHRAYRDWQTAYKQETAASVMSEVVASITAPGTVPLAGRLISMLMSWAQQTYEGNRIAFSIGIDPTSNERGVDIEDIAREDSLKVLSNGQDTLVIVNQHGELISHETLTLPYQSGGLMAPIRFEGVAYWTAQDEHRAAIALNRNGDILTLKSGLLLFARRRGDWRYFAHDSVIARFVKNGMAKKSAKELRREIYRSALDAAFARAGACIGVVNASLMTDAEKLIPEFDRLQASNHNDKSKAVAQLISGKPFQQLDRRLRLELVSIDGATVLSHTGTILAVGSILSIKGGGKAGGGREAASRALGKCGLGIKVSNDGYIRAINRDGDAIVEIG